MRLGESIDMRDIGFVDKERRVGGKDELCSDIRTDFLHHPRQASLHLRMKMNFRFIDDEDTSFEIVPINSENHDQEGLFSITQIIKTNAVSIRIRKREFQKSGCIFHS
jgi:hypothetical protein